MAKIETLDLDSAKGELSQALKILDTQSEALDKQLLPPRLWREPRPLGCRIGHYYGLPSVSRLAQSFAWVNPTQSVIGPH